MMVKEKGFSLKKLIGMLMCIATVSMLVAAYVISWNSVKAVTIIYGSSLVEAKPDDAIDIVYEPVFNQTEARSMLESINEFRTGEDAWYWNSDDSTKTTCAGLEELVYDYDLEKVAMQRAAEIALAWGHERPDGRSTWSAYDECGYERWSVGENIAAGYTSAYSAYVAWREDNEAYSGQGHRRNMLNSGFKAIGIACVTVGGIKYWVQEFSSYVSSDQATDANDSETEVEVSVTEADIALDSVQEMTATVDVGSSIAIPDAEAVVKFAMAWPSGKKIDIKIPGVFVLADNEYVSIKDNTISGLKAGTGSITGEALGENIVLNVTVNEKENKIETDTENTTETINEEPENTSTESSESVCGDVDSDGTVTPKDVTMMRRFLAGGWNVDVVTEDGDVDGDGSITPKDVTMLRRYLAGGWGVELPKKNTNPSDFPNINTPGGWEDPESLEVPENILKYFENENEANPDSDQIIPIAVVKKQVVAGTNYGLISRISNKSKGEDEVFAFITVYVDLSDKVQEVSRVYKTDTLTRTSEDITGWKQAEDITFTNVPKDVIERALSEFDGVSYKPVAILLNQPVYSQKEIDGWNVCMLFESKVISPGAESTYVLIYVFVDMEYNVEMTDVKSIEGCQPASWIK